MNTTAINNLQTASSFTWPITIIIFLATLAIIFLLSKNIRQFFYGAIISGVFILNYKFSRWIGTSAGNNNYNPLKWFCYIVLFIIISIVVGRLSQKLKFVKKIEGIFK